jgi:carboxypeptidase T
LSDYAGQTIKARFRLETDQGSNFDGFYFDDFKVNLLQNTTLAVGNNVVSPFGIYPNPANSVLNITTIKIDYKIKIFNLQGQLLFSKENNNGIQTIDVNFLKTGMYLIELKSDSFSEVLKFSMK